VDIFATFNMLIS